MERFCGNCGTEVDETAVFCPTCGQPIEDGRAPEMPAAPTWPDPAADDRGDTDEEAEPVQRIDEIPSDIPTRVEQRPPPSEAAEPRPAADRPSEPGPVTAPPSAPTGGEGPARRAPRVDLPITTPVTLTAWLIGVGAVLAVIGLIVVLVVAPLNVVDLLLLLALLGVVATVFFSTQLPAVPHLRLMTLVIALIAFGVALDRIGFRGGIGELLLFMGSAAASIGAVILELGHDQPLGGPQR